MTLHRTCEPLCEHYDLAMLDLDGVVYIGQQAVPGAAESLKSSRDAGLQLAYITNNASRTTTAIAGHLRDLGLPDVRDEDVVTSAQAVAHLMAAALPAGSKVLVVGDEGLIQAVRVRGLCPVDSFVEGDTAAVVQGFSRRLSWEQLAEGTYAVTAGVPWYASNADKTFPSDRGVAPGNGSMIETIAGVTGTWPIVAGKPETALFDETLERVGGSHPIVVGDRLDTDIEGAANAGFDSLAVLTGVSDLQTIVEAEGKRRPSFVAPNLAGLLVPHPKIELSDNSSRCGAAEAVLHDDRVTIQSSGSDVENLRAIVELAWAHRDRTGKSVHTDGMMNA